MSWARSRAHDMLQAVVEVFVDQGPLGVRDRRFDGMQLLGDVQAGASRLDHLDHAPEMALGALEALGDLRM
jgi:hypothetical protein